MSAGDRDDGSSVGFALFVALLLGIAIGMFVPGVCGG